MEILEYQANDEREVIDLILDIQTNEFGISITKDEQPDLLDIPNFYQCNKGNFWIARHQGIAVGTISLLDIDKGAVALRKMFVHPEFRGKEHGVSASLLRHALSWATSKEVEHIYLGTTARFLAAHRFYEKNGFVEIPKTQLPKTFSVMEVDSKFYVYTF